MFTGLDDLSSAERRFLVKTRRRLRDLDPWTRGHFAESLVAELISAELSPHTASPWDLDWPIRTPPLTIAVRATGGYSLGREPSRPPAAGNWKFPPAKWAWDGDRGDWLLDDEGQPLLQRCHAEVAVLCHHHGFDITDNWTFHVLPQSAIENWPAESLSPRSVIEAGYPPLDGSELSAAIRAVCA